jgi:hypothetical protein
MKQTPMCSILAVALTGCMGLALPVNKVSHRVPVVNQGGQLVAYKVVGNVGDDQAANAGIRVRRPSLDELRTWERVVELAAYSDAKACFHWTDYQSVYDEYGDGQRSPPATYADYKYTTIMLDTPSGQHYESASPIVESTPLTFQYDSYATDEYLPPRWIPAVAHFERVTVETCFDTAAPLAGEGAARWTIKGKGWELAFDFDFRDAGDGGTRTVQTKSVKRAPPAPEPAPPKRPESFLGRWTGEVALTLVEGEHSDGMKVKLTLAIVEASTGKIALGFEGGAFDCAIKAKVIDRRATIAGGQVCKLERPKGSITFKTIATELALSETGLVLSLQMSSSKRRAGKTEKGMITMTGELAPI